MSLVKISKSLSQTQNAKPLIMSVTLDIRIKHTADVLTETGPTRPYWMKMIRNNGTMQPQYYSALGGKT